MAGQLGAIVLAVACAFSIQPCFSQNSSPAQKFDPALSLKDEGSVQTWREYLQQLPPDEKEKLEQNLRRWEALSPEEREFVRRKEAGNLERMRQAAQDAITNGGLKLSAPQHEAYVKRYVEERRDIERPLRNEMQHKRKPLVEAMTGKLNTEFAATSTTQGAPAEAESPGPRDATEESARAKFAAWQQSSPEPGAPVQYAERQAMKKRIVQEIDRAIKESGLNLTEEQRLRYSWRYIQMRGKIERQLHGEFEAQRKPQVDALVQRLNGEFAAQSSPAASVSASPQP